MKTNKFTAALLASYFLGSLAQGDVVKPVSATSTIAGDAGSNVNFLLNDNPASGEISLQDDTGAAVALDTGAPILDAICALAARSGSAQAESWTRGASLGNPVFVFDLTGGGDTDIGSILLWQYGNNGGPGAGNGGNSTREFSLIFHTEAEGDAFDFGAETTEFTGSMAPIYGDSVADNVAQPFFFGASVSARYVALRIDSNYLSPADPIITGGGDRYGLGEVRFATEFEVNPQISIPSMVEILSNGATETVSFQIENTGASEDLTVTALEVFGIDQGSFTLVNDLSSPLVIPAGTSVTIEYQFDPTGIPVGSPLGAEIEITSNGWFKPFVTLPIEGLVRDPWIAGDETVDLGTILPGAGLQNFTVTVENLGSTSDLTISDASVTGDLAFDITDDLATTPLVIPAGDSATLNLTFDPNGIGGQVTGLLTLTSDDAVQPIRNIPLTATVERDPELSADTAITFGPFPFGSGPQTLTIPLANVGANNPLEITNVDVDIDDPNFSIDSVDTPIAPGQTGNIVLNFDPQGKAGCFVTTLIFDTNDIGNELPEIFITVDVTPQALPGGLVAWWSMDDANNPGADLTGNGFDGNLVGTLTGETGANATTDGALRFSGGSRLEVPQCKYLNPDSFTIVGWACPDTTAGIQSMITSRYDSFGVDGNTYGYIGYIIGGNWEAWNGTPIGGWATNQIGVPSAGAWQHIAYTYDASSNTKSVYLNGVQTFSGAPTQPYQPNLVRNLHIGAGGDFGAEFPFTGKLDDLAIFDTVLSPSEVGSIAAGGVDSFLNPVEDLQIELVSYDGTTLVVNVTGALPDKVYKITSSTNLTLPFADTGVTFASTTATGLNIIPGVNSKFFIRAEEVVAVE